MTIREYFDRIDDMDERFDAEEIAYEMEEEEFIAWAEAEGIDLTAMDEAMGETVVTLWAWDMCGD